MDLIEQLRLTFVDEAFQMLEEAEKSCLALEKDPTDIQQITILFRQVHNIKGSSKSVEYDAVGDFAHVFENLLTLLKDGEIISNSDIVGVLLDGFDHLRLLIEHITEDMTVPSSRSHIKAIEAVIAAKGVGSSEAPKESQEEEKPAESAAKEEEGGLVLFDAEPEPTSAPEPPPPTTSTADVESTKSQEATSEEQEAASPNDSEKKSRGSKRAEPQQLLRVPLTRVEELINNVGELAILSAVLRENLTEIDSTLVRSTISQLSKVTKEVQDISMHLRMVPLAQTFHKLRRIVRDTATATGKKVDLAIKGEEAEIDKTVIEKIGDPLVHIVRNAVDHGIEGPESRKAKGKSEAGSLKLEAYHQSGKFVLDIKDDGGGIDTDRIRGIVKAKNLHPDIDKLPDSEVVKLIFLPGLSTKEQITDVSGRGVGMDVVKSNIDRIGGEIHLTTKKDEGTHMQIVLPQTLAIIDAMVVEVSEKRFVVPIPLINETIQISNSDIRYTNTMGEIMLFRGENLPFYRLARVLDLPARPMTEMDRPIAIVVKTMDQEFAVLVDTIIGQYQVVVKNLHHNASDIPGIIGSAILGDGKPALILGLDDLIEAQGFKLNLKEARMYNEDLIAVGE